MIESKTLGAAVGIQRQGVIDKTESTTQDTASNGLIVGSFKRGRMDKPFLVTKNTYQALLGHDPTNPDYNAVEDALNQGVSGVWVRRIGAPGSIAVTPTPTPGPGPGEENTTPEAEGSLLPSFTFQAYTNPSSTVTKVLLGDATFNGHTYPLLTLVGPSSTINKDEMMRTLVYDAHSVGESTGDLPDVAALSSHLAYHNVFDARSFYDTVLYGMTEANMEGFKYLEGPSPMPFYGVQFEKQDSVFKIGKGVAARALLNKYLANIDPEYLEGMQLDLIDFIDEFNNGKAIKVLSTHRAIKPPFVVVEVDDANSDDGYYGWRPTASYDGVVKNYRVPGADMSVDTKLMTNTLRVSVPDMGPGETMDLSNIDMRSKTYGGNYSTGGMAATESEVMFKLTTNKAISAGATYFDLVFSDDKITVKYDPRASLADEVIRLDAPLYKAILSFSGNASMKLEFL